MAEAARKVADKKSAEKDVPEEKQSGKGKLLLVSLALVVVAAGSAGGAVFWMKSREPAKGAAATQAVKKSELPAIFIPLEPPFVVNFKSEQSVRFLQVAVQVMTHEPATVELVKLHDPVIRNDLLLLFGDQQYEVLSTRAGKEKLQAEALAAIRAIVARAGGKGEALEALYFTSFVMQ